MNPLPVRLLCLVVSVSFLCSLSPLSPALAQQEESQESSATPDEAVDEVIYVTARKREEPLQETPISITAITSDDLEERTVIEVQEISDSVPNLKLDQAATTSNGARIYIRGIGQDDPIITADPGVGMYVDGIYLGRSQASLFSIIDVERIEVLRGPQGTLFGRNTVGGAINVVTQRPTSVFGGNVTLRGGEFDLLEGRASINGPASDKVFLRFNAAVAESDGYMTNAFTGADRNGRDLTGARFAVRAEPSDSFGLNLSLDYTDSERTPPLAECLFQGGGGLTPFALAIGFRQACEATQFDGDPYLGASNFGDEDNVEATAATLDLEFSLSADHQLKATSGYRQTDTKNDLDVDASTITYVHQNNDLEFEQFSQELQFSGAGDGWDYVAGLFYYDETVESFNTQEALTAFPLTAVIPTLANFTTVGGRVVENENAAAYGQANFDLGENFVFTAGARYTEEEKRIDAENFGAITGDVLLDAEDQLNFEEVTGLLSLGYTFTDRTFGYVSASRGFKSGGFNGRGGSASGFQTFEPEFVNSLEVGYKYTSAAGNAVINTSLYYNDYEDIQLTIFQQAPDGNFQSVVRNAGEATVQGLEIESRFQLPARVQMFFNLGLTDAGYDTFFADLDGDTIPTDNSDLEFKNTPEYDYSLALQRTFLIGNNGLTARVDFTGRDETFSNVANSPSIVLDAYDLLGARLAYDFGQGRYQLAAWGKNLTDEVYKVAGVEFTALGFDILYYAPPLTWGLDFRVRF